MNSLNLENKKSIQQPQANDNQAKKGEASYSQDDLNQPNIKLGNGIAISVGLIVLLTLGWYFERQLSLLGDQSVTVTIESSEDEVHENDSTSMLALVNSEETNRLARLLRIELLDTSLSLSQIDSLPITKELSEIEKKSVLVLAIKLMIKQKHLPEALSILGKLSLTQRLSLGLQFSKALVESKLSMPRAIDSYEELLIHQPRHQAGIINLAYLYLASNQPKKAELVLRQQVDLMSSSKKAKAYAALARSLVQQKQYNASQAYFLKSIEYRPSHAKTWGQLASARAAVFEEHALIKDSFVKAISLDSKNLDLRLQFSFYLIKTTDYQSAVEQLKQARKLARNRFNIRLWLAFCYSQIDKPVNANKQLVVAAKYAERNRNRTKISAFKAYLAGDYRSSIDQFKTLLKSNRNNELEYLLIALAYSELNKRKSAKVYLDKILPESILYYTARLVLADNYSKSKQFSESLLAYQSVVESINNDWSIYYRQSETAAKAGDDQQAIAIIDKALSLNNDKKLQLHKAKLLWQLQRRSEAIKALSILIESKPNYLRAIYRLADYNLQIGAHNQSIELFKRILAAHPEYSDVQYRVASQYLNQGETGLAKELLEEYLARRSGSKKARLLYARVFCETGQSVSCKEQLQLLFKLDAGFQPAIDYAKANEIDYG